MEPRTYTGVKGGKYVLRTDGEKLYVPLKASHWTLENGRWRLHLTDGRNMLYPALKT